MTDVKTKKVKAFTTKEQIIKLQAEMATCNENYSELYSSIKYLQENFKIHTNEIVRLSQNDRKKNWFMKLFS